MDLDTAVQLKHASVTIVDSIFCVMTPCSFIDGHPEAVHSSETLVTTYKTTWCHNLEDNYQHLYYYENLKYVFLNVFK
jgi:hypothetical protein